MSYNKTLILALSYSPVFLWTVYISPKTPEQEVELYLQWVLFSFLFSQTILKFLNLPWQLSTRKSQLDTLTSSPLSGLILYHSSSVIYLKGMAVSMNTHANRHTHGTRQTHPHRVRLKSRIGPDPDLVRRALWGHWGQDDWQVFPPLSTTDWPTETEHWRVEIPKGVWH